MPRHLLGDEFGNLHMLTLMTVRGQKRCSSIRWAAVSCTLSTALAYPGWVGVYVGSALRISQLVHHDEPRMMLIEEEKT
jgi:hypothetical protein